MSITELIRWFVAVVGSLSALAVAIQCLIGLVKLVKEVMDGVEKGLSISKSLKERRKQKNVIVPGTPQEFRRIVAMRQFPTSGGSYRDRPSHGWKEERWGASQSEPYRSRWGYFGGPPSEPDWSAPFPAPGGPPFAITPRRRWPRIVFLTCISACCYLLWRYLGR